MMLSSAKISLLGLFEVLGNASSDISINFWIDAFPIGMANFTILLLSSLFYVLMVIPFVAAIRLWMMRRGGPSRDGEAHEERTTSETSSSSSSHQRLIHVNGDPRSVEVHHTSIGARSRYSSTFRDFFHSKCNVALVVTLALADVSVDVFGTYAAGHIPVIVQVVLKSVEPFFCWLLSCFVWKEKAFGTTSKLFLLPAIAVLIAAGGVVTEAWVALQADHRNDHSVFWILIFALRVIGSATYNVTQGTLMRRNAEAFQGTKNRLLLSGIVLGCDAVLSGLILVVFGPLIDTVSYAGWGTSTSVASAWSNAWAGTTMVFTCGDNLAYAIATNGAWMLVYVADTFMNEASPALNSLLNMLSSPASTLLLIAVPSWDLGASTDRSVSNISRQVFGVCLMFISIVVFYQYEKRKHAKERVTHTLLVGPAPANVDDRGEEEDNATVREEDEEEHRLLQHDEEETAALLQR